MQSEEEPSSMGFDPATLPATGQHLVSAPPRHYEDSPSILGQTAVLTPGGQADSQPFIVPQKYQFLPQGLHALLVFRSCTLQRVACHEELQQRDIGKPTPQLRSLLVRDQWSHLEGHAVTPEVNLSRPPSVVSQSWSLSWTHSCARAHPFYFDIKAPRLR